MPGDAAYVIQRTRGLNGFYGAGFMERLPTEKAITTQVKKFTQINFSK